MFAFKLRNGTFLVLTWCKNFYWCTEFSKEKSICAIYRYPPLAPNYFTNVIGMRPQKIPELNLIELHMKIEELIDGINGLHPSLFYSTNMVSHMFTHMYRNEIVKGIRAHNPIHFIKQMFALGQKLQQAMEEEEDREKSGGCKRKPVILSQGEWALLVQMKIKEFERREQLETQMWKNHRLGAAHY